MTEYRCDRPACADLALNETDKVCWRCGGIPKVVELTVSDQPYVYSAPSAAGIPFTYATANDLKKDYDIYWEPWRETQRMSNLALELISTWVARDKRVAVAICLNAIVPEDASETMKLAEKMAVYNKLCGLLQDRQA